MGEMFEANEHLSRELVGLLREKEVSLSLAESCTGGLISHLITQIPGTSKFYKGSLVAYQPELKINLLKVDPASIERYQLESPHVTEEMAQGMRALTASDIACATNGIAGPGPGSSLDIPIGQVFIALASSKRTICHAYQFFGQREDIKLKASIQALKLLIDFIKQDNAG